MVLPNPCVVLQRRCCQNRLDIRGIVQVVPNAFCRVWFNFRCPLSIHIRHIGRSWISSLQGITCHTCHRCRIRMAIRPGAPTPVEQHETSALERALVPQSGQSKWWICPQMPRSGSVWLMEWSKHVQKVLDSNLSFWYEGATDLRLLNFHRSNLSYPVWKIWTAISTYFNTPRTISPTRGHKSYVGWLAGWSPGRVPTQDAQRTWAMMTMMRQW